MSTDELMGLTEGIAGHCALFKLRSASRRLSREYEQAFRSLGLKGTQFSVLVAVCRAQGRAKISQLADALALDRTALSRTLTSLERRGLLERSVAGRQNMKTAVLTPAGEALLKEAAIRWRSVQDETRARVGDETWTLLQSLPARLAAE